MAAEILSLLKSRTDENGSLLITSVAAGTTGPLEAHGHGKATSIVSTAYLSVAEKAEDATRGPATPFLNLRGHVDGTSLLFCLVAAGASAGPRTPLGQLKLKTDGQGFVIAAAVAAGAVLGPKEIIANLLCRQDENGSLLVAVGP